MAVDAIYVDHGLTGTNRDRPGLREALAACRTGDTLVVTKLDRLARSLPDGRDIADTLTRNGVTLNLGGSRYDPTDPVGKLLFNVLALVAEFEADLIRAPAQVDGGAHEQRHRLGRTPDVGGPTGEEADQDARDVQVRRRAGPETCRSGDVQVTYGPDAAPDDRPDGRDVVIFPANGEVHVQVAFQNFGDRTVYHCHILDMRIAADGGGPDR